MMRDDDGRQAGFGRSGRSPDTFGALKQYQKQAIFYSYWLPIPTIRRSRFPSAEDSPVMEWPGCNAGPFPLRVAVKPVHFVAIQGDRIIMQMMSGCSKHLDPKASCCRVPRLF